MDRCILCVIASCLLAASLFSQGLGTMATKDDWEEINFAVNSSILSDGYPSLLRIADLLQRHPEFRVKVAGHTDDVGSEGYNDKLALGRANAVRDFLTKFGASANQIFVTGKGKREPESSSTSSEGRFMNRRVILTVTDSEGKPVVYGTLTDVTKAVIPGIPELHEAVSMQALADLNVRKTPPAGIFNTVGDKVGIVKKSDVVIAREEKVVRNLFGQYIWYNLDVLDPMTSKPKVKGWVYAGSSNGPQYLKLVGVPVVPHSAR